MWIIELNIAGRQFTRQVPDLQRGGRPTLRWGRRTMHRRGPQLRHSPAV